MNSEAAETAFVPLSHTLGMGQWDKSEFHGTTCGTSSRQVTLKSLAIKVLQRDKPWDKFETSSRKLVGQDDEKKPVLSHMDQGLSHDETDVSKTPTSSPCAALQTKDEPKAAPPVRSKSEPSDTPHHGHTPKGVDIPDSLHRLAGEDTNVAALVNWGLAPHLQDGELVIDGMDTLDAESRAGLERWLAHKGPGGEPRRERVARALRTERRAAC